MQELIDTVYTYPTFSLSFLVGLIDPLAFFSTRDKTVRLESQLSVKYPRVKGG